MHAFQTTKDTLPRQATRHVSVADIPQPAAPAARSAAGHRTARIDLVASVTVRHDEPVSSRLRRADLLENSALDHGDRARRPRPRAAQTINKASASMARVTNECQPVQVRTW
jgi:hypothetical protein